MDSPERFFVEIQFSNGANYAPTLVEPPRHTMPTQPRRLMTAMPGVTLQKFQVGSAPGAGWFVFWCGGDGSGVRRDLCSDSVGGHRGRDV